MSRFRQYLDYYRRKLERNMTDETAIIPIVEKLSKTDFPVNDLLNSGIYKLIRHLGKSEEFKKIVFPLYDKWKMLILAAENDQMKIVQNNIPVQNRVPEPLENDINDLFKGHPMEIQNGFTENIQRNAMHSASFRPIRNQLPVNNVRMKSSTVVQPPACDMGFKMRNLTPPASDMGFKMRNLTPPASDIGFKMRNLTPPASDMGFKMRNLTPPASDMGLKMRNTTPPATDTGFKFRNSTPPSNDGGYKIKNSSPVQPPANNGGYKFKSSTPFQPSASNGGFNIRSSTPVQPPVNKFQPFSNLSASFPVHNVNTNENSTEQITMPELSVNFDSQSNCSNALSSPHSSNSQNPLDIGSTNTSSPNKIGRIPDPYTIEMKEGMFRVVKCFDGLSPEIIRVKRLYNREEDNCDSDPEDKIGEKLKTKKREHSPQNIKNSKSASNKNVDKSHSSKSKNHTPEKSNKHKLNAEKHSGKSEKVKTSSPLNKSAIDKSKLEKKVKEKSSDALKNLSPYKVSSKTSSKGSPVVKSSIKGSPSVKSSTKGSPIKTITKGSPQVKSSTKGSPSVFVNHASSCDIPRVNPAYRDCDKRASKVLPSEATDSFMCSKKERTSMYSGKKSLQEVPSLRASCVQVLKKNIDSIRNARQVPYEVLKPVLQNCSATQLFKIEEHNNHLLTSTEEIWKSLCQRKYRDMKPSSTGTWRNLYWKTREDQEKKLKNITASISASMHKAAPERQTKLTLIESPERPRSKKIKLSVPEPKLVLCKESSSHPINSFKESNAPSHKFVHKEPSTPSIHPKSSLRESHSSGHKKAKKAPVAPLMSKVKKTILAMHKK